MINIRITENTLNEGFSINLEIGIMEKNEKVSFKTLDEVISYVKEKIYQTYDKSKKNDRD
jgi:uncharacterized protein YtpQ (UPF0354 family)